MTQRKIIVNVVTQEYVKNEGRPSTCEIGPLFKYRLSREKKDMKINFALLIIAFNQDGKFFSLKTFLREED